MGKSSTPKTPNPKVTSQFINWEIQMVKEHINTEQINQDAKNKITLVPLSEEEILKGVFW